MCYNQNSIFVTEREGNSMSAKLLEGKFFAAALKEEAGKKAEEIRNKYGVNPGLCGYSVLGIALGRVVYITAYFAFIFFHIMFFVPFSGCIKFIAPLPRHRRRLQRARHHARERNLSRPA